MPIKLYLVSFSSDSRLISIKYTTGRNIAVLCGSNKDMLNPMPKHYKSKCSPPYIWETSSPLKFLQYTLHLLSS